MLECTADMDSLMSSPKALRGEKGTDYWHINTLSYPQRETEVMLLCMWILVKKKDHLISSSVFVYTTDTLCGSSPQDPSHLILNSQTRQPLHLNVSPNS